MKDLANWILAQIQWLLNVTQGREFVGQLNKHDITKLRDNLTL